MKPRVPKSPIIKLTAQDVVAQITQHLNEVAKLLDQGEKIGVTVGFSVNKNDLTKKFEAKISATQEIK